MLRSQGLVSDSRVVQPGDLFVALEGGTVDGHKFIPAAIEAWCSGSCVATNPYLD